MCLSERIASRACFLYFPRFCSCAGTTFTVTTAL
jgi:hypothetical protein